MRTVPPAHTPLPPTALLRLGLPNGSAVDELRVLLASVGSGGEPVLVGSGTQALTRALGAMAGPGGVVGLPGWGCYDLASAAVGAGVRVRLYDLDPETLQPDADSLARVAKAARVLVLVSFFGIPVEAPGVDGGLEGERPFIVHDAAQAHGMDPAWGSIAGLADATVLSFGRGKGWTGGSGGALVVHSGRARGALAHAPVLRPADAGRVGMAVRGLAQWLLGRPALYGLPARVPALALGETRYHPPSPPAAMADGSAAVLLAARAAAEDEARFRRARAEVLRRAVGSRSPVRPLTVSEGSGAGYLRFPVLDSGAVDRDAVRPLGILPSYPRPLATLEPLKALLDGADPTPGSDRLARELLTLPTHSRTSARDRARLEAWLRGDEAPPST